MVLTNVSLSIPANLNGFQGGVVAVPVRADLLSDGSGNTGMSRADIAIDFDSSALSVSSSDIFQGTAPAGAASFFSVTSSFASGQMEVSLTTSASPIASAVGTANTPITITTVNPLPAGLPAFGSATISGIAGFPAANGTFGISVTGTNTFTLNNTKGVVGSSTTDTGNWVPVITSQGATNDSLVTIDFHVNPGAALGNTAINLVNSNSLGSTDLFAGSAGQTQYTLNLASGGINVLPSSLSPALGSFAAVSPLSIGNPGIGTMLLLSDGSVMVDAGLECNPGNTWYLLTPDSSGNYADGTWHALASSNIGRLFFGSVVMQNGDVMVLGGEDTVITGSISSVVGTATTNIMVTTVNPLPAEGLISGNCNVKISGVTGFANAGNNNFNINGTFGVTVTGTNTFTLNGQNGIVGSGTADTGTFEGY